MNDEKFVEKYEELLNKGYCNCNEMNCIDNNSPRRILDIVKNLQQENKELSHIVANKVIYDYDIDTPLKKELGEANLKIVSLEAAIHCYKQEREDLIKWLEDKIKECDKTLEILNSSLYTDEIKSDLSINPIIPKVLVGNFLETLDKVRGINND